MHHRLEGECFYLIKYFGCEQPYYETAATVHSVPGYEAVLNDLHRCAMHRLCIVRAYGSCDVRARTPPA
eukprot:COSAG01_NODE_19538_length_1004_cov_1.820994_2_plen_68_part_01